MSSGRLYVSAISRISSGACHISRIKSSKCLVYSSWRRSTSRPQSILAVTPRDSDYSVFRFCVRNLFLTAHLMFLSVRPRGKRSVFVQIAIAAPSAVVPGRGSMVFLTFLIHWQNLRDMDFLGILVYHARRLRPRLVAVGALVHPQQLLAVNFHRNDVPLN